LTEPNLDRPVRVTGEERPHPAIRKLARACIALALLQLAAEDGQVPAATAAEHAEEGPVSSDQEQPHG